MALEEAERLRFQDQFPNDRGILLAEQIHEMCTKGLLISAQYEEKNVRPASYTLRIGSDFVDSEGNRGRLTAENNTFVFKKNSIVFVSTMEQLNLPFYIIARFNVRVTWVYNGVLLGTGPQIDPGFAGHISSPLYNLTDLDIVIKLGEDFATIDFEKTTTLLDQKSPEEKRELIEKATHAKLVELEGHRKTCFYKLGPMLPLQHCKQHRMVSSLFEMRAELRRWRALGIGAVISFFMLTLSLLGFGANLYRQQTDNTRQINEAQTRIQEANGKIAELSNSLEQLRTTVQSLQRPTAPTQTPKSDTTQTK